MRRFRYANRQREIVTHRLILLDTICVRKSVGEYSAHRRGAPGLEPICSHILHRSISPTRLIRCTRSRTSESQHIAHGRECGDHGAERRRTNLNGRRPRLRHGRLVGRHGRQGDTEKQVQWKNGRKREYIETGMYCAVSAWHF